MNLQSRYVGELRGHRTSKASSSTIRAWPFFLLVFILSSPFWLISAATNIQLLPGLPISALAVLSPVTAALILAHRSGGNAGVVHLLKRAFELVQVPGWYLPAFFLAPVILLVSYSVQGLTDQVTPIGHISAFASFGLFFIFLIAASFEELGWTGYILDRLQSHYGTVVASLLLGSIWAAWHVIPLMQAHRALSWIAWWSLETVAQRVIMVWLYNKSGRKVFAPTLFHATHNLAWQLYPIHGSTYDPRISGVLTACIAGAVIAASIRTPRNRGLNDSTAG